MIDAPNSYYHLRLVQQHTTEGEAWTASHPQLPGCHAVGRNPTEAIQELGPIRDEWLSRAHAAGEDVPPGSPAISYELILSPSHGDGDHGHALQAIESAGEELTVWLTAVPGETSVATE